MILLKSTFSYTGKMPASPVKSEVCGYFIGYDNLDDTMGSKSLGDQGYSPIEILRYYYGDDMYINTAEAISGIPSSWPGYTLKIGSSGNKVRQMQEQLNVIAGAYPAIPKITADGIYGPATAEAVRVFQKCLWTASDRRSGLYDLV